MTTEIHVVSTPDLSIDNKVMNLSGIPLPEDVVLVGASWVVANCSPSKSLLSVLRFIYRLIGKNCSGCRVWLFIGNSAWQPDTRIVRYRKLWGGLAARGITILNSCNTQEVLHKGDRKLKFFGATQLSESSIESVVKALLEEHCSYLVIFPKAVEPINIIDTGWSGNLTEDFKFIGSIIMNGGLLMKRFGEFDDEEKGIIGIGQGMLVNLLVKGNGDTSKIIT